MPFKDPEARKQYQRAYDTSDARKEYTKQYRSTPEYKENKKLYNASDKCSILTWSQNPKSL